jgi:hypothetical protein
VLGQNFGDTWGVLAESELRGYSVSACSELGGYSVSAG